MKWHVIELHKKAGVCTSSKTYKNIAFSLGSPETRLLLENALTRDFWAL